MSRTTVLLLLCISAVYGVYYFINLPKVTGANTENIDVLSPPYQSFSSSIDVIHKTEKDTDLTITPIADYSISGMVLGTERYYTDRQADLSPIDVSLAWGALADPKYLKEISFSQSGRFYYYTYSLDSTAAALNIGTLSSNSHIIPANDNILKAVKSLKKNQRVTLDGSLVNVTGKLRGLDFYWNTSTVRNDTGNGACEIIYVKRVTVGNNVYE